MYLIIDVGATYTKYGYYQKDGSQQSSHKFLTVKSNREDFYSSIIQLVTKDIVGISISMPGLLDSASGYVESITLLPFLEKHNIIKELSLLTHLPISIENDAKCATLGEMWKGHLKNVNNGLMIVIGSGIGGTLIINGQIINSKHHKVGEIGSILMPKDLSYNQMTNFGRHNNANHLIKSLSEIINCENDGKTVFSLLKQNKKAMNLFMQYCKEVAFMIYNLDYILDLDIVCIGGGISEQAFLISSIEKQYRDLRKKYKEDEHEPKICSCQYHNEANLLGALYHHIEKDVE